MATNKIISDTDVLLDYMNLKSKRHLATKIELEDKIGLENVVISAITKIELLFGSLNKQDLATIQKNINPFLCLLINNEITLKAVSLIEQYALSHKLALPDSIIAASSLTTNIPLFTYNIRDYQFIPGIKLYKPY